MKFTDYHPNYTGHPNLTRRAYTHATVSAAIVSAITVRAASMAAAYRPAPAPAPNLAAAPAATCGGWSKTHAWWASVVLVLFPLVTAQHAQVLVSDFNNDRIVRYQNDGSAGAVLVAAGAGGLNEPHRSRVGPDGLLYVASAATNQILRFNATTGNFVDTFAGGGVLSYPVDLMFRPDGFLYVSSQQTNAILRYATATGARDTSWSAQHASLTGPSGLVFDSEGNLFVAGRTSNNIVRFDATTGTHELSFGTVNTAFGLALLPDGRLLAASGGTGTVQSFTAPGSATPAQASFASGLSTPVGLELSSVAGTLLVANFGAASITRRSTTDGSSLGTFASGGLLSGPNFLTSLDATAIPEPAAAAWLTGLLVLTALAARRRLGAHSKRE